MQYAAATGKQRSALKKQIATAASVVQEQYQKVVGIFVNNRRGSLPTRWKETPHTDMYHVKNRGEKSTVFKSIKDLDRIRWAASAAKITGAGALLIDFTIAGTAIKQAYDTSGNTTKIAFEEIGEITLEAAGAILSAKAANGGVALTSLLFPALIIPGVGLVIIAIAAGASGAIAGNILGKKLGISLYKTYSDFRTSDKFVNQAELNAL